MSAAEKLKALAATMEDFSGPDYKAAFYAHIRYRDALPQIVAVVEAAEGIVGSKESQSPWGRDVLNALAALDEALS